MKDKSKFISSVIVSLLSGFIYYMFGQGINEDIRSSLKTVLSSNEINDTEEHYLSSDCFSFNSIVKNSDSKDCKKKLKFYIRKRSTIEFKDKDITIPGEEAFSEYVSNKQAKFRKPTADKNLDFTAELDLLIKSDLPKSNLKPGKEIRNRRSTEDEIADTKELKSNTSLIHKNAVEFNLGNGFEYNFIIAEKSSKSSGSIKEKKNKTQTSNNSYNTCNSYYSNYETSKKECNGNTVEFKSNVTAPKVIINAPQVTVKVRYNKTEAPEMTIPDEETGEDSVQ